MNIVRHQKSDNGTLGERALNLGSTHTNDSLLPGLFPPFYQSACIMVAFDLPPTLNGLHLISGRCDGVAPDVDAMAGFLCLNILPHTALLGHHGVNVHGSENCNKSMIVHIKNTYKAKKMEDLAREMANELRIRW